jgi:formate C-acetyltransferase
VGGTDEHGRSACNALTSVILDAIDLLDYKEPTLLVRWREDMDESLRRRVAELVARRRPVTIYNDEVVVHGLVSQGVPVEWAHGHAHSACHNVLVVGHEAASGPAGFYNVPRLLLDTMGEEGIASFPAFMEAFRRRVRDALVRARASAELRWSAELEPACPLLQSALMRESISAHRPCWQAASVSHFNHHLMGLATVVDSLIAIRHLVFEQQRLSLPEFRDVLEDNWEGREALRAEIRQHLPRYGQDCPETRLLVAEVGWMWVEEVEAASRGLTRARMWPGFYSHMAHVHEGRRTGATPDGRAAGDPLSESLGPSPGTPACGPTALLNTMSVLPFTHTPSGAASLALPASATGSPPDPERIRALIDAYFALGGLHLHINALSAATLLDALRAPDRHADLMVRVAGFSALFVRLSPEVQQDIVSRFQDGD